MRMDWPALMLLSLLLLLLPPLLWLLPTMKVGTELPAMSSRGSWRASRCSWLLCAWWGNSRVLCLVSSLNCAR